MTLKLVPQWQHAWKWFSVRAAVVVIVLSTIRETAQHLVDTNPSLDFIANAHWFAPTMAVMGVLIALLRLIHQPVDEPTTYDPSAVPTPTEGTIAMNANFTAALNLLPALITQAEQIFTAPSSGADKAAAVAAAIAPLVPAEKMAQVSPWMNFLVSLYNLHGILGKSALTPAAPAGTVPEKLFNLQPNITSAS